MSATACRQAATHQLTRYIAATASRRRRLNWPPRDDGDEDNVEAFEVTEQCIREFHRNYGDVRPEFHLLPTCQHPGWQGGLTNHQ